jgi:hypothetical protein
MTTDAAKILGAKGGKAKSEAKTIAARVNARKPRKNKKPIPLLDLIQLLKLSCLELSMDKHRCVALNIEYEGLKINGHDLPDVIKHNLEIYQANPELSLYPTA